MGAASNFSSEKARIEDTILSAINTSLEPAVAARKALAGAFPSASFTDKEDGTLSVQDLDAAQRQSLEDSLFELNLSLANQAVAKGVPLMRFLHVDASHQGIMTIPRFLQVALELARPLLSEPLRDADRTGGRRRLLDYEGWARLFEGLMEVGTIADCSDLFRLMEGDSELVWSAVFCSEDFRREQGAKLTLLRMSNMLFRRLSKAYDVQLCGRLLIFISRCYELNDKSGLNVAGALNSGLALPVDEVEAGAVDSIGEQIDRRLYGCFWGLQSVFQNPAQVLQPAVYGKVLADMGVVVEEFAAIKTPVAATGPWVATRHSQPGEGVMEVDGGDPTTTAGSGEHGGVPGGGGGGAGARYLTSSKLFGLQLRDCTFRRHFLLQCLALLQYIEQPNKADKSGVGPRPEGLEALRSKLYAALSDTKDHGPEFAEAVHCVLQHEAHWVAWKHGTQPPVPPSQQAAVGATSGSGTGSAAVAVAVTTVAASDLCRDFTRPTAPPTREVTSTSQAEAAGGPGAAAVKRKRGAGGRAGGGGGGAGRFAVSRGVMGLPDPAVGLRVGERRIRARNVLGEEEVVPMLPSAPELLAPIVEDLDPDNDVEPQYRRIREPVFAWKRMRTLARNCLEFFKKGDDLEDSVLEMHPELRTKIAVRKKEREAELAAAAAAEAGEGREAGEALMDGPEGAGGDSKGVEEGEALPSPTGRR